MLEYVDYSSVTFPPQVIFTKGGGNQKGQSAGRPLAKKAPAKKAPAKKSPAKKAVKKAVKKATKKAVKKGGKKK